MIINNLSYKSILTHVSFEFKQGIIYVILGENGSGKSTLLRTLSGFYKDYEGSISLSNKDLKTLSNLQLYKTRAVLTQNNHLNNFILCREYLELGAYNSENTEPSASLIGQISEKLKIAHLLDKEYGRCSGGEQQRMHLARVFIQASINLHLGHQQFLLLDEPFNHLDVKHIPIVVQCLKDFKAMGCGILVIMHDINLANHICDEALLLKQGKIICSGPKKSVFTTQNLFLAFDISFEEISTTHGESYFKS